MKNFFIRSALLLALALTGCRAPKPVLLNSDLDAEETSIAALPRAALGPDTAGQRFDHRAWGALLAIGVRSDGAVDYAALKLREQELNAYLVDAGDAPLDALTRHEQLALLLNVYNACTVKMILENPGIRSVTDIPAVRGWRQQGWLVDRTGVSLQQLDRDYIRRRFPDPRIHFALVRGARGSPPLRAEPYDGRRIEEQLNDQARRVCADPRFVEWNPERNLLRLGGFFGRYRRDFAEDDAGLVRALLPWLPAEVRAALLDRGLFEIEYAPFDWSLNGAW
jgi:hypothetical protein